MKEKGDNDDLEIELSTDFDLRIAEFYNIHVTRYYADLGRYNPDVRYCHVIDHIFCV